MHRDLVMGRRGGGGERGGSISFNYDPLNRVDGMLGGGRGDGVV